MLCMTFGEKLSSLMKRKNLTRNEVKDAIGVSSANTITNYVNGSMPDLAIAHRLAKFLGVPLDWLADDTQDDPPPDPSASITEDMRLIRRLIEVIGEEEAISRLSAPKPERNLVDQITTAVTQSVNEALREADRLRRQTK